MNYRILGRTGLRVSALGFGCMRFPMKDGKIDDGAAIALLRRAVELGVNYFDTAVGYGNGQSQRVLGDASHGIRDKVILSTKNPHKDPKTPDVWWRYLEESLRLLRTDHIDIYNMHGLSWDAYEKGFKPKGGLLEALFSARDQGMIRHLCFSTHDTPQNIMKLADEGLFESVTLQYNLLNRDNEPAIAYLKEKNMGVVVMGPVAGGRLANQTVEGQAGGATSAQLAFKFVLSNPNVTVALSGMNELKMLEENVAVASEVLALSQTETAEVERASKAQARLLDYYCTACGYCMPCLSGVDIPGNFTFAQLDQAYGMSELARTRYADAKGRARYCLECGACLEKCPQKLNIPEQMRRLVERLDPDAGKPAIETEMTRVSQGNGGLQCELTVVPLNLTGRETAGEAALEVCGVEALRREITLKPRKHKKIEVSVLIRPEMARGPLLWQAVFEGAAGKPSCQGETKALFAHRVGPGDRVEPDQVLVHGPGRVASGKKDLTATHGTRFRVANDGTDLILAADVDEDLLGPASPREETLTDCLDLFLDCRSESEMRKGRLTDGCARLRLLPGLKDGAPRIEAIHDGGLDFSAAKLTSFAKEGGYCVEARIPLSALRLPDGQRVVGFDLAQISSNEAGESDFQLVWSGGRRRSQATDRFGLAYLE